MDDNAFYIILTIIIVGFAQLLGLVSYHELKERQAKQELEQALEEIRQVEFPGWDAEQMQQEMEQEMQRSQEMLQQMFQQ